MEESTYIERVNGLFYTQNYFQLWRRSSVGRVLETGSKGHEFETLPRRHYFVSLRKTLYPLLSTGSTQEET